VLRPAVGLLLVGACGLLLAVVAFGAPPPGGGTGPPTWVPGPPPCHGHSACPPPSTVTSTSTVSRTTTVSTTTTVSHTTTLSKTTTLSSTSTLLSQVDVPGPPSGPPYDADVSVTVTGPAGDVFAGGQVTYTATVANAGPSIATGVHLGIVPAGSRVLSSAAGDLGELDAGASTTATFTLAPTGAGTLSATFTTGADQPDPQLGNNVAVVSTPVLAGHAGAPSLEAPDAGAFAPPLFAVRTGGSWLVATKVHVDEAATVTVRVLDRSGKPQTMLPGTLVDFLPANRPHLSIPHDLLAAAWMPLRIRIGGPAGRSYRVVVQAAGPDGSVGSASIAFRTR
jgi:uncharacterized repeat protein (TIGR01451 family)